MKSIFFLVLICSLSSLSFSQQSVNQTDSKGLKQGKWVAKYSSGTLKYEGSFVNNKPVGDWRRYHENGKTKALMNYRLNSARVFASLFDEEGKLYAKGVFEGTLRDSTWNFYSGNLIVQSENFHLGKKEGKAETFDQNGKLLSEKVWKNDSICGQAVEYFPDGTKRNEVSYKGGKKNGPALFYDENGVKSMEGSYCDDLSDGDWKVFDKNGKLKYQIKYARGEILNSGALDTLQVKEFEQYEKIKGKIPEPKLNESGIPDRP